MNTYKIYTDGSFNSSNGSGGYSFVIIDPQDSFVTGGSGFIKAPPSSTSSEIIAAHKGIESACSLGLSPILIISDSILVARLGALFVKDNFTPKKTYEKEYIDIYKLVKNKRIDIKWGWVKGHSTNVWNSIADKNARSKMRDQKKQGAEIIIPSPYWKHIAKQESIFI